MYAIRVFTALIILTFALLVILVLAGCSWQGGWRPETERLEFAWQVAHMADTAQTIVGRYEGCHEMNPILGTKPSPNSVMAFGIGMGVLHIFVTDALEAAYPKWVPWWEGAGLAAEGAAIVHNQQILNESCKND